MENINNHTKHNDLSKLLHCEDENNKCVSNFNFKYITKGIIFKEIINESITKLIDFVNKHKMLEERNNIVNNNKIIQNVVIDVNLWEKRKRIN